MMEPRPRRWFGEQCVWSAMLACCTTDQRCGSYGVGRVAHLLNNAPRRQQLIDLLHTRPGFPHRLCSLAVSELDRTRQPALDRYVCTLSTPGTFSWMLRMRTVRALGSGVRRSTSGKFTEPTVLPTLMYLIRSPRVHAERVQRERYYQLPNLSSNPANAVLDNCIGDLHADRALGLLRGTTYATMKNAGTNEYLLAKGMRYAVRGDRHWAHRCAAS